MVSIMQYTTPTFIVFTGNYANKMGHGSKSNVYHKQSCCFINLNIMIMKHEHPTAKNIYLELSSVDFSVIYFSLSSQPQ